MNQTKKKMLDLFKWVGGMYWLGLRSNEIIVSVNGPVIDKSVMLSDGLTRATVSPNWFCDLQTYLEV